MLHNMSKKKIFVTSSLACAILGVGFSTTLTYLISQKFDEQMENLSKKLSSDEYNVSYESQNNFLFSKKGKFIFSSSKDSSKNFVIPFKAAANPVQIKADFFIPETEFFKNNLNKYQITKVNIDAGFKSAEIQFDVDTKTPVMYQFGSATLLTNSFSGLIEINDKIKSPENYILNIGSEVAVVKFQDPYWKDSTVNLYKMSYSAPVEMFLRKDDDYHAPYYSYVKAQELHFYTASSKYYFYNVGLYRKQNDKNTEGNGLKFSVGNGYSKIGSVVIEGTNTTIKNMEDIDNVDANYNIRLVGPAFNSDTNILVKELEKINALKQKEFNIYESELKAEKGKYTFNNVESGAVVNKLLELQVLNSGQHITQQPTEGIKGNAPQILIEEEQSETADKPKGKPWYENEMHHRFLQRRTE